MNPHPHRRTIGKYPNEGARLLWAVLAKNDDWSQADLAREIGVKLGHVSRWLYCDRRPGLENANQMHRLFKIPTTAWHADPRASIVLPALAAMESEQPMKRAAGGAR